MEIVTLPLAAQNPEAAALFCAAPRAEASAGWFTAIAETTLEPGESAILAALKDGTSLLAALPLAQSGSGAFRSLTAPYTTIYSPLARSLQDAHRLGAGLAGIVGRRLDLDALDPGEPITTAFLAGLEHSGLIKASFRHFANWYEAVEDFGAYWAARPGPLRETVRRKSRKVKDMGGVFLILRDASEIGQGIRWYEEIYADSGKVPEPHPRFMSAMMASLAGQQDLRLGILLIGQEPVAAQLWLVRNGQATIFKLAHRRAFAALSPGTLLTHWMFSDLLSRREIQRVDFGRGNDPYKPGWLRHCTFRRGVIACNPANLSGICDIATRVLPTWASRKFRSAAG